jgi:hypothetical protein
VDTEEATLVIAIPRPAIGDRPAGPPLQIWVKKHE